MVTNIRARASRVIVSEEPMKPSPPVIRTVLFCHQVAPFASFSGCPLEALMSPSMGIAGPALQIYLPYHGPIGVGVMQSTLGAGFSGAAASGPARLHGHGCRSFRAAAISVDPPGGTVAGIGTPRWPVVRPELFGMGVDLYRCGCCFDAPFAYAYLASA